MALTGPLPSAVCTYRCAPGRPSPPGTHTFTVASVVKSPLGSSSVITRIDSTRKNSCSQPSALRMSSSSEASAASKW